MVRSSGVAIFEIKLGTSRSGMGNSGCLAICQPNSKSFEVYGLPSCHVRPGRSLYTVIMVFFWVSIFQVPFFTMGSSSASTGTAPKLLDFESQDLHRPSTHARSRADCDILDW